MNNGSLEFVPVPPILNGDPDLLNPPADGNSRFNITMSVHQWLKDDRAKEDLPLDNVQAILLCLILLYSTDSSRSHYANEIDGIQAKYGYMLQKYLKHKYRQSGHGEKFFQAMALAAKLVEVAEMWNAVCQS